jgi:hypothetical protein
MLNAKKSRRSIIALSIFAAFIICSAATVYALASNPGDDIIDDLIIYDSLEIFAEESIIEHAESDNDDECYETPITIDEYLPELDFSKIGVVGPYESFGDWDVIWWTYEEFKVYIAEQKATLEPGTHECPFSGIFYTITQKTINERIQHEEAMLEGIKNGTAKLSKTVLVDGKEDPLLRISMAKNN